MTDDEAVLSMVDSNLQREKILPSEKAFAYKMRYEVLKRQAGRPVSNNLCPVGTNLFGVRTDQVVANEVNDSARQVHRYIRLTELIKPLLDMVDEGKIAFRPAVEISYLTEDEQKSLLDTIKCEECTPSLAHDVILSIISEEKPNQKEKISFPRERLQQFIPKSVSIEKTEEYVFKALEHYQKFLQRNQQER